MIPLIVVPYLPGSTKIKETFCIRHLCVALGTRSGRGTMLPQCIGCQSSKPYVVVYAFVRFSMAVAISDRLRSQQHVLIYPFCFSPVIL
jgi:hypothetical protein